MVSNEALAMQQAQVIILKSQRVARAFDGKPGLVQCVIEMRDEKRKLDTLVHAYRIANRRRQQEQ